MQNWCWKEEEHLFPVFFSDNDAVSVEQNNEMGMSTLKFEGPS